MRVTLPAPVAHQLYEEARRSNTTPRDIVLKALALRDVVDGVIDDLSSYLIVVDGVIDDLSSYLIDNTDKVFEEIPEIDNIRTTLIEARTP